MNRKGSGRPHISQTLESWLRILAPLGIDDHSYVPAISEEVPKRISALHPIASVDHNAATRDLIQNRAKQSLSTTLLVDSSIPKESFKKLGLRQALGLGST
jgi:hypothetical protein